MRPVLERTRDLGRLPFRFTPRFAKPQRKARAIRIDCADKWYEYMSLEEMASPRVLFALDLAGKPLPDKHGAPLRLIDPPSTATSPPS